MCELFAMSSRLPTTVNFSLEEFARHGGVTGPNRDGWGVAYYDDGDVRLIKEPEPASDSDCVKFIEQQKLASTIVLSHIRRATQGARRLKNTQPFSRELGGRIHIFAHNGDLQDIQSRRELQLGRFRPIGDTDSEYAFCVLMHRMESRWLSGSDIPPLEDRVRIFRDLVETLRKFGPANIIYSDGDVVFVHGHKRKQKLTEPPRSPGLHVLCRRCATPGHGLAMAGIHVRPVSAEQEVVLVASVPLTHEDWRPLEKGEILVLRAGRILEAK